MNLELRHPLTRLLYAIAGLLLSVSLPVAAQTVIVPPNLHPCNHRTNLVISEFRYRMVGTSDFLPFVKITNAGPEVIDISGYQITGTLNLTLGSNVVLQPAQSHGVLFVGTLSDPPPASPDPAPASPEIRGTLELRDKRGAVLLHIEYSSEAPWPALAYAGHSLVLSNPSYGENDPRAWSASPRLWQLDVTGTNPIPGPRGKLRLNELRTGNGGFVEIYNPSATVASLTGMYLFNNPELAFGGGVSYNLGTNHGSIPAGGYLSIPLSSLPFTAASTGGHLFLQGSFSEGGDNVTAVIDLLRYGTQDTTVSIGRSPNGHGDFVRLAASSSGTANGAARVDPIVISEIMYHPASEPAGVNYEFIELYNRSATAFDLRNWRLRGSTWVDFNDAGRNYNIAPGGRLVVPGDRGDLRNLYGLSGGANNPAWMTNGYDGNGDLPNSNGVIRLQDTAGVTVDEVSYRDGEGWPEEADEGGSSLELIDVNVDNNIRENWAASNESAKAAWQLVSFSGNIANTGGDVDTVEIFLADKGECHLDDIVVRRSSGSNLVANPGFNADFSGWTKEGTHEFSARRLDGGTANGPCLHLKAGGRGDYISNRVAGTLNSGLSNDGGAIVIQAQVRWISGSTDLVIRLRGHGGEAIGSLTINPQGGTPNAANSRGMANGTPLISQVAHTPVLPLNTGAVTVTAKIKDATALTVSLNYRIDESATVYSPVSMNDSGTGGDVLANDGTFTGVIPAPNVASGLLAYYITATDSASAAARYPSADPVYPDDPRGRECLIRYDEQQPAAGYDVNASYKNHFPSYHLWMTAATRARWEERGNGSNADLDVTFVWNNARAIYNGGAHYSGSFHHRSEFGGPTVSNNQGYNLSFPSAEPFLGRDSADIDSNSHAYAAFREQASHWLAAKLGLQSTHRRYCHFIVNNTRIGTVYEDIQEPGDDFLDEFFPGDDGDLFKLEVLWEGHALGELGNYSGELPFAAPFALHRKRWMLQKRATDTPNDYSRVIPLVNAFSQPDPQFTSSVTALADTVQWMKVMGVERIIGNTDAYGWVAQHNMYAYKPEGTGRWQLLIYDTDYFTAHAPPGPSPVFAELLPTGHEPGLMIMRPQFLREYLQGLREAYVSGVLNGGIQAKMDTLHALLIAEHPGGGIYPFGSFVPPDYNHGSYTPKTYFNQRHQAIGTFLTSFSAATLSVTSSTNTTGATYTLEGIAPPDTRSIRINGNVVPVEWFNLAADNPSGWRAVFTLNLGNNNFAIQALDKNGTVIGSTLNFTVNYAIAPVAQFIRTDSSTRGMWINKYGTRGYWLPDDDTLMLDPVTVSTTAAEYDWPEYGIGSGLQRASAPLSSYNYCVHSPDNQIGGYIEVNVTAADTAWRQLSLYMYDWDFSWGGDPRVQRIELRNPVTNALLSSRAVTRFHRGKYLTWRIQGNVRVRIIYQAGAWNSVLSGVFIDPDGHVANGEAWVDDSTSTPAGATFVSNGDPWDWSTTLTPALFGTQNHTSAYYTFGMHQHYFWGATATLISEPDDVLYSWARIDNTVSQLPAEVMLQWYVTDGRQWNNRAYWGSDLINYWGPRVSGGSLPTAGQWARLDMPAWKLKLANIPVSGMAYTLHSGRTVWDRAGRETGQAADTDDDNLPDAWEQAMFGNLAQSAAGDPDGDWLVNLAELHWNSNPSDYDTDNDNVSDGEEAMWYLSDPSLLDSDADGWTDDQEINTYGTDPNDPNSHP
jgi:hypothetical protein